MGGRAECKKLDWTYMGNGTDDGAEPDEEGAVVCLNGREESFSR